MFEQSMRILGFVVNAILLIACAFFAFKLTNAGLDYLSVAGGVSGLSSSLSYISQPISLINAIADSINQGTFLKATLHYIFAWVILILAAGAWWMTALGVRWLFFAIKRLTVNF